MKRQFRPGYLEPVFTFLPHNSPTMGQFLACTRRKQLEKFADEELKPPSSPIVAPPDRETIYIAYVVLLPAPVGVLISHIRVMGSTGSGKTTVCLRLDFGDLLRSYPDSSSSIWRRAQTFEKAPAWKVAPTKYRPRRRFTSADNRSS